MPVLISNFWVPMNQLQLFKKLGPQTNLVVLFKDEESEAWRAQPGCFGCLLALRIFNIPGVSGTESVPVSKMELPLDRGRRRR